MLEFSNISPLILASLASKPIKLPQTQQQEMGQEAPAEKQVVPESLKNQPTV
jgi:hypothetical protein